MKKFKIVKLCPWSSSFFRLKSATLLKELSLVFSKLLFIWDFHNILAHFFTIFQILCSIFSENLLKTAFFYRKSFITFFLILHYNKIVQIKVKPIKINNLNIVKQKSQKKLLARTKRYFKSLKKGIKEMKIK